MSDDKTTTNSAGDATTPETKTEIKKLGNSEIEIDLEIPTEEFESNRKKAVQKLADSVEIPGFRKGHIPESVLLQKIGESAILHEMAEFSVRDTYPKLLSENKIDAIGQPEISITKIAKGNPLGVKIKTAVMPELVLPDYRSLAQSASDEAGAEDTEVTEEELNETIDKILENWKASAEQTQGKHDEDTKEKKGAGIVGPDGAPISSTDNPEDKSSQKIELTDELVKKIGKFASISDFKQKIRDNLKEEKKIRAKEKKRMQIMEAILKKLEISVPQTLISGEKERMMAEFKGNIAAMGIKAEEYFKKLGKDEGAIKEEWNAEAEKRVKSHLVLHKIAETENITVPEEDLEKGVSQFLAYNAKADPERARNYLHGMLLTEKVFQFLEDARFNSDS
jgi:trigger factor